MAKIIINRTFEFNNMARNYGIYLNGIKIGTIGNGKTKEFELEAGNHLINGKIDWCKSPIIEVNINENECKEIEISGFKYGNFIMPIGLGVMSLIFLIKYFFKIGSNFFILLAGIGFLYPLYYFTLGKNNYLTIQEKK